MEKPFLLDLFCGGGGCSRGYQMAGFRVRGVDIKAQTRYIGEEFVQADALEYLERLIKSGEIEEFAAISASPPCQTYSASTRHLHTGNAPRLIGNVRDLLIASRLPWVIENVEGAPLPRAGTLFSSYGTVLCGTMFQMPIWRHRIFEGSIPLPVLPCRHKGRPLNPVNASNQRFWRGKLGGLNPETEWRKQMGVIWMTKMEARQAIPPAYTRFIGEHLMNAIRAKEAA